MEKSKTRDIAILLSRVRVLLDEPKKTIEVKHGYEKQGQILLTRLSKQYQEFEGWSVKL